MIPTVTVLVGILFNNYRMTDLRTHLDARMGDLHRLMDANTRGIMDKLESIDRSRHRSGSRFARALNTRVKFRRSYER